MGNGTAPADLYVWASPRDVDADTAEELIRNWLEAGGDPASSPFDPSTDIGWFHRELKGDQPALETTTDALPSTSRTPVWLSTTDEPPARIVGIRVPPGAERDVLDAVFGLATKYDLVLFDVRQRQIHRPLEEMAAFARATFWPRGAIQAAVAGGFGGVIALIAWSIGIPILSGLLALAGGFMFAMAVYSFIHEGRAAIAERRTRGGGPQGD